MGYLTAFLNSKIFRFAFKEYFPELLGDTRELSKVFFENVSVIPVSKNTNKTFEVIVETIHEYKLKNKETISLELEIEDMLAEIYSLSISDKELIESSAGNASPNEDRIIEHSSLVNLRV